MQSVQFGFICQNFLIISLETDLQLKLKIYKNLNTQYEPEQFHY